MSAMLRGGGKNAAGSASADETFGVSSIGIATIFSRPLEVSSAVCAQVGTIATTIIDPTIIPKTGRSLVSQGEFIEEFSTSIASLIAIKPTTLIAENVSSAS